MKIITVSKCMKEIRSQIDDARKLVLNGSDKYEVFNMVYESLSFADRLYILKKKKLDILWKELQDATK